jgi:hypothetical protein
VSSRRRMQWLIRAFMLYGAIVAIINIAFQLAPEFVMGLLPQITVAINYGPSPNAPLISKIFIPGQGLMIFAFFLAIYQFILKRSIKFVILVGLMGAGLLSIPTRGGYIAISSALMVGLVYLAWRPVRGWFKGILILAGAMAIIILTVAAISPATVQKGVDYLGSAITDLELGTGSYGLRLAADAPRLDLVRQSPLLGVGFIHDAESTSLFDFRLLTTDTGVDVLVEGGILLAICLAWNYLTYWLSLRRVNVKRMVGAWPLLLAFGTYYLYLVLTTPSSSILALDDGLLVLAVGMGFLYAVLRAQANESTTW